MRPLTEIIIHCSATPPKWMSEAGIDAQVEEITRWHKGRGFRTIGYHYVIGRRGEVRQGRSVREAGAHVKGHNKTSIGICLIGGKDSRREDSFGSHYTAEQDAALRRLIGDLLRDHGDLDIKGHNDYTDLKGCPGFRADRWLAVMPPKPATQEPERPWWTAIIEAVLAAFGRR